MGNQAIQMHVTTDANASEVTGLVDYALNLQHEYEQRTSAEERKRKGQYFTPPEVCTFMAELFREPAGDTYCFVDPGAGIGALTAALCERLAKISRLRHVEAHVFENHPEMLPYLRQTMDHCRDRMEMAGRSVKIVIHREDFILDAAAASHGTRKLFDSRTYPNGLDAVITNPPYFKINKSSPYARIMNAVVHGQPNMYALFLAASAQLLRPGGEMVAITPRSFCNGLYFREFRRWFFERMSLDRIHLFESRTDTFRDVLQESIITLSHRLGKPSNRIAVSTSYGRDLIHDISIRKVPASSVVDNSTGGCVIRVPTSEEDSALLETVESWPDRFSEQGLRVSTGPVVAFRARKFLIPGLGDKDGGVSPLLSVFNIKPFETVWPAPHKKHVYRFKICCDSMKLLLPAQNYVLLRRFSAKEERRRLTASCLLEKWQASPFVALENHLNYVYHAKRPLSVDETYGLAALFNSALLDRYFRTLSGNTQVNATELRTMPFPTLETIAAIGREVQALPAIRSATVETIVLDAVGVHGSLRQHLLDVAQ